MTTVFYTHLDRPLKPDLFDHYLGCLSTVSQQKILKLHRDQDQQASLLGKMLLLQGLVKFGYQKESLKELMYTEYNRPFINLPVDFSISHSGELVVCALSSNCKVGIDVEEIRPVEIEDFKDALSIDEYNDISVSKNDHDRFFNIWTRKEAVIKANGQGLSIPLKEVILENDIALLYNKTWHLKDIFISKNYSSSIATDNQLEEELPPDYVNKEDLIILIN